MTKKTSSKSSLTGIALYGLWAVGLCLFLSNTTLKRHLVSRSPAAVQTTLPTAWFLAPSKPVVATHFFTAENACAETIAEQLLVRGPSREVDERIVLIGTTVPKWAIELAKNKFFVRRVESAELPTSLGLANTPQLWLESSHGKSLYRGGYFEGRPAVVSIRDLELFHAALSGKTTQPYPVADCAPKVSIETSVTDTKQNSLARGPD